jgi:iron(III) transport system permease protein
MASLETSIEQTSSGNLQASLRRLLHWLSRPHVILSLIMLFLMYYMIVIPLYRMFETTFTWQMRDLISVPGAELGGFTLYHYMRMVTGQLSKIYLYTPLQHSLTIATGATLLSLVIGGSLAWLVIRTDMPGRKIVNQLAVLPYIMPSWTLAQAWLVFFKNRLSGGTPGVYEYLVGQSPPDWLSYGPVPIIICSALHYYTFFFLFVSAALMSIDSSLEEAGELMGSSRWRILRKITFPLVMPAILSGFIMTFSKVMGTFGGPNILGAPVRYYVVSTMIRGSIGVGDRADGFVLAIVLILFSLIIITLNQRLIGTRRSYETIGGRGFVAQVSKLRQWKKVFFVGVIIFQLMVIVIPLGLLVWSSLMLQDGNYSLRPKDL